MKPNKYKKRDEWKKLLLGLSHQEFENLCYDILRSNGFINLKTRGRGGDGGRDIEGELRQKEISDETFRKYWFQCKLYDKTPLNYDKFSTEVNRAQNQGIDRMLSCQTKT